MDILRWTYVINCPDNDNKINIYQDVDDTLNNKGFKLSSSSTFCAASMDIPDPLSSLLLIVHRFWQVFRATSCILTELLYVCLSWSSCFCSAIWGGP